MKFSLGLLVLVALFLPGIHQTGADECEDCYCQNEDLKCRYKNLLGLLKRYAFQRRVNKRVVNLDARMCTVHSLDETVGLLKKVFPRVRSLDIRNTEVICASGIYDNVLVVTDCNKTPGKNPSTATPTEPKPIPKPPIKPNLTTTPPPKPALPTKPPFKPMPTKPPTTTVSVPAILSLPTTSQMTSLPKPTPLTLVEELVLKNSSFPWVLEMAIKLNVIASIHAYATNNNNNTTGNITSLITLDKIKLVILIMAIPTTIVLCSMVICGVVGQCMRKYQVTKRTTTGIDNPMNDHNPMFEDLDDDER